MKPVEHSIRVFRQPTDLSCGQTCVAMLLSHFGEKARPKDLLEELPLLVTDSKKEWGSSIMDLALLVMKRGYRATIYSYDTQIIRLTWAGLTPEAIINELKARKGFVFPMLGKNLTKAFMDSYVKFLEKGGKLEIKEFLSVKRLYQLIKTAPIGVTVSYNTLYGTGGGLAATHFVVAYGYDAKGNFLIADPWKNNGRKVIEPERLASAIMAAQMTCENMVVQIHAKM